MELSEIERNSEEATYGDAETIKIRDSRRKERKISRPQRVGDNLFIFHRRRERGREWKARGEGGGGEDERKRRKSK